MLNHGSARSYINGTRRIWLKFLGLDALAVCGDGIEGAIASHVKPEDSQSLSTEQRTFHEQFMQEAIREAYRNPVYPFGAVISNATTGEILARGVNASSAHPMFHGEVVAINDYVARHGNHGWADTTLYTTGEPCAMCMSAIAWAGIRRVVWASSINVIREAGIPQIDLGAAEVSARANSFYRPEVFVRGVLAGLTDRMFLSRRQHGAVSVRKRGGPGV